MHTLQQNKIPFHIWTICSDHTYFWDKHKEIAKKKRLNFFNKSKRKSAYKEPEQLDSSSSSSTSKQLAIYGKINISEVTYAEIRWVLKIIAIGFSTNSVDDVCDTFKKVSRE